jgi:hypothetical protein
MPEAPEAEDLTARLIALREAVEGQIAALRSQSFDRMGQMDKVREQLFAQLIVRFGLIQEEIDRRYAALQLQLDQRFGAVYVKAADLQTLFRQRMDDADSSIKLALAAAETAVNKAETAAEKRFDSVNEFRKTLSDQTASFVTKDRFQGLDEKVSDLASRLDRGEGSSGGRREYMIDSREQGRDTTLAEQLRLQARQAQLQYLSLIIAAVVLAVGIFAAFHK